MAGGSGALGTKDGGPGGVISMRGGTGALGAIGGGPGGATIIPGGGAGASISMDGGTGALGAIIAQAEQQSYPEGEEDSLYSLAWADPLDRYQQKREIKNYLSLGLLLMVN
eukprot:CAMPEP_0201281482 /NCGR_PEP_ID=MMETSP1317-20130820/2880_1 /ASSEMBLY_ACC=CAM_ASM_000770 /TAXON_ID=187299 /ORGANISM="Undescribed Undescribed, Strain Undescribed" /LENGTH=110 /DNA_ID=CAMNT_0047591347 /DNA_START=394 /DNA_END=727 /DNA_ORIENTATION=-